MKKRNWLFWTLFMSLFALVLVACGGTNDTTNNGAEGNEGNAAANTDDTASADKPTITLIQNTWPASELNINVAKILIEQELGYPVEIVTLDEDKKATMVSNLLVVLCGDKEATPVVNTGTLYQ